MLTNSDLKQILDALARYGKKDSQLDTVPIDLEHPEGTFTTNDYLSIVQDGKNKTIKIKNLEKVFLLTFLTDEDFREALKGRIPGEMLENASVTTEKLADGSITTIKLGDSSVTNAKLSDNAVTSSKLADSSVTTSKIVDESVTTSKLNTNAVTTDKLANGSVTTDKIANGAVTSSKIADNSLSGANFGNNTIEGTKIKDNSIPGSKLADGAIESIDIKDGTLSGSKLADNSVTGAKLQDSVITGMKIANNSIPGSKIADSTIQNLNIANNSISGSKLVDNAITTDKIANGAINSVKLANDAITENKIAEDSVTTNKIADRAVTNSKLANNSVTSDKIADNSVTYNMITDYAVTENKLDSGSVTASKIAPNAVTTTKLGDNAITSSKIVDGSVTEQKLADESVTTDKINTNAVTNVKIADNAVTESKIATNAVTTAKIADGNVTTVKIVDNTVTTVKLTDGAVTEDKLADGAVTTAKLADGLISEIQNITDATPTEDSVKPVQSGGVKTAIDNVAFSTNEKVKDVGIDNEPTAGSDNLVKSSGVNSFILENVLNAINKLKSYFYINLFNKDSADNILNKYINTKGTLSNNSVYSVTHLIPFTKEVGNLTYTDAQGSLISPAVAFNLYDKNLNIIRTVVENTSHIVATWEEGVCYVRFTIRTQLISSTKITLGDYSERGIYTNYGEFKLKPLDTSDIKNSAVTLEKLGTDVSDLLSSLSTNYEQLDDVVNSVIDFVTITSKNLFNPNDPNVAIGKYINKNTGTLNSSSTYSTTGFIKVTEGNTYYLGYTDNPTQYSNIIRVVLFYDDEMTPIPSSFINNTANSVFSVTAPEGAAYMRITMYASTFNHNQVTVDERSTYEEYFEPYQEIIIQDDVVATDSLHDKCVTEEKLSDDLRGKIDSKLGRFVNTGEVAQDNYLLLPNIHIGKNNFLSCSIDGNITDVEFGVGYIDSSTYLYRDYQALWVKIDATYVTQYRYTNGTSYIQISQVEHGMTFTNKTKVEMANLLSDSYVKIYDDLGNVFKTNIQNDGTGRPFIKNNGLTTITCAISDFPMDLNKPIWLFGDSYISFTSSARWTYYLVQEGYVNWLSNNQSGLAPATAWINLQNLLSLGKVPKTLIWLLGMNGDVSESQSEGQYVINSYQKTYIDNVVNICNSKGIELIIGVIPTVPSRQKTGFGNYVKSLGVRYIDFAYAVGTNSSGEWNTGLLSNDNVHPTAAGAKVLASQALVDCPELAITD